MLNNPTPPLESAPKPRNLLIKNVFVPTIALSLSLISQFQNPAIGAVSSPSNQITPLNTSTLISFVDKLNYIPKDSNMLLRTRTRFEKESNLLDNEGKNAFVDGKYLYAAEKTIDAYFEGMHQGGSEQILTQTNFKNGNGTIPTWLLFDIFADLEARYFPEIETRIRQSYQAQRAIDQNSGAVPTTRVDRNLYLGPGVTDEMYEFLVNSRVEFVKKQGRAVFLAKATDTRFQQPETIKNWNSYENVYFSAQKEYQEYKFNQIRIKMQGAFAKNGVFPISDFLRAMISEANDEKNKVPWMDRWGSIAPVAQFADGFVAGVPMTTYFYHLEPEITLKHRKNWFANYSPRIIDHLTWMMADMESRGIVLENDTWYMLGQAAMIFFDVPESRGVSSASESIISRKTGKSIGRGKGSGASEGEFNPGKRNRGTGEIPCVSIVPGVNQIVAFNPKTFGNKVLIASSFGESVPNSTQTDVKSGGLGINFDFLENGGNVNLDGSFEIARSCVKSGWSEDFLNNPKVRGTVYEQLPLENSFGEFKYEPPSLKNGKIDWEKIRANRKFEGFVDTHGNIWKWDKTSTQGNQNNFHWDVQIKNSGQHFNVNPNGEINHQTK